MARHLENFFQLSLDLLSTADARYHFDELSPSWQRVLGWSAEELRSRPFLEFCHPDDVARTLAKATEMLSEGSDAIYFENRYRHKEGHYLWLSWTSTVRDGVFYSVARDITEQKRQQEALMAANRELQQFSYAASHDLAEPLRTISGHIQIIKERGHIPEASQKNFQFVKEASERMREMLKGLLQYSRLDQETAPRCPVQFSELLERTSADYPDLKIDCAELPQTMADSNQMQRLVQNILSNAWKYRHQERTAQLDVSSECEKSTTTFRFRDNGVGINPGQEERALQIFGRCHSRTEYPHGQGIGLALCKQIVERHQGKIYLRNNEDGPGLSVFVQLERLSPS